MSNFRGRRVTEPTPIIRAPPNTDFYHDASTLSGLAQAWDSMGKAKSVLRRVEHRLEDARRPSPTSFEEREKETCISMDEKSTKVKNENSLNKSHTRHKDKQSLRKISRLDDKFKDDYIYTRSRSPLASLNYDRHFVRNESRTLTPTMHLNDDHDRSITPTKHVNFIEKPEFHEIESRTRSYLDQNSNMSGKRYGHGSAFDKTYETEPYGAYAADDSIVDTPVGAARETEINFLNDNLHLNVNRDYELGLEAGSRGLEREDFPKLGSYNAASSLRASERRTKTPSPYMLEGGAFDHYGCAYTGSMDDMDIVAPGRRIRKGIKDLGKDSDGLARIKELIDEQRRNMSSPRAELGSRKEEESELLAKVRHQESDAVMLNSYDAWEQPAGQPLSRKIAAGPPAPSYKGFNEVETKIRTPEGRVVKVPSHRRKTKKVDRVKEKPKTKATEKEPPPPQIAQAMSPLDDTPVKESQQKKSARVQATKKPSKFERKDIITTKSWREGQKLIRRELGPLPKPSVGKKKDNKSMDDSLELEEPVAKPWDRDNEDDDKHGADEIPKQPEPRPILSEPGPILSEEAKDVLHDLALDIGSDSEHSDDPHDHDGADKSRRKHTMKRKAPTSEVPSKKEPIAKVRHYDSDEVRRYIQKQQNERKKRQEEEKRAQKEAEENRQKQLQELYMRARSKTTKPKPRNRPGNETRLDETFSKGPAPELSKRHPSHEDHPSMGPSGSDMGNFDSKKVEVGRLWNKDAQDDSDTLTEESDGALTPRASPGKEGLKPAIPESEPMQLEDLMDRYTSSQAAAAAPEKPAAADADKPSDTQQNTQEIPSKDPPTSAPAVTTNAPTSTVNQRPLTAFDSTTALPASYSTRPYSALYPEVGQNRTRADRLQALRNTAASLQNRLDAETHRLTADANILPRRSPLDPALGASRDAWGYSQPDDSVPFVSRHDKIAGTHDDYSVFNRDLPGVGNLVDRAQVVEGDRERNDAATTIQAAYRGHTVRQSMDWKMPSGSPMRSSLRKDVHLEPRALTSSMDRYNDSDVTESLDESDSDYINRRIGAALFSKDYCASNTEIKRSPVEFTQVPSYRHLTSSKPRYMWEENRADPLSIYNIHTRRLQQQNEQANQHHSPHEFYTRETVAQPETAPGNYNSSSLPGQDQPSSSTLTSISPHGIDGDTPRNPDIPNLPLDKKDDGSLSQPRSQSFQQKSHSAAYEDDFTGEESTLSISENTISGTPPAQTKEKTKSVTKSTHSKKPDSLDSELSSLVDDQPKPKPAPRRAEQRKPEKDTQFRPITRELPREYHMRSDNIRPVQPGRLSPGSLERKLAAELNLLEGMEESVRQLTDVERTRAVSLAQQETVTLAQILKGRQQTHDREMAALQHKARQESMEATQQLNQARHNTTSAEERANRTVTQVRQEATTTLQDSTAKLLETQAAAAMTTAEAARQLAEAKNVILNHPAAVPTEQTLKMATEVASAAATAAVQATLAKHEKPPLPRSTRRAPSKDVSEVISSAASSDLSRSLAAPYSTESFESESTDSKSTLGRRRPKTPELVSESVQTALDDSSERTPKADDSTIKTDPGADADKTESISEELASEKDYSFSFDETMTEDEIEEHSFRAVLPSEGHRRRAKRDGKSDGKMKEADHLISVSSDDVTLTNTNLNIDNITGPFTQEESFKKFTAAMVRQYMKEEEIRAQHQAALLKLREKALKEKTKAELDWLEQQKKHHREKGADDIYPQIKKKQRGLMLKLQQEQAEIKRLREASRVASKERQLMLYQQQEIQRLRQSAAQVRDKLKKDGPVDDFSLSVSEVNTEDEISIGFDDHSEIRSPSPKSKDYKSDSEVNSQQERSRSRSPDAKVMRNIKKMKADPKYLTAREKKLAQRRRQAEELLKWKKRLDKEEKAVYSLEVEAINVWDKTGKATGKTPEKETKKETKEAAKAPESAASETLITASDASKSMSFTGKPLPSKKPAQRTESESSIVEDISGHWQASASLVPEALSIQSKSVKFEEKPIQSGSESSVFEEVRTASQSSSIAEDLPTVTKSSKPRTQDSGDDTLITSNHSVREEYSNDTFVSGDTTTVPGAKPPLKSPVKARVSRSLFPSDKSLTPRSPRSPRGAFHPKKKGSESESEDSFSYTQSETASISDASDIEGRIRALNEDLKRRKSEADRLKKEQKKRHKDRLKAQEASLKKQIEAYDNFISQVKTDLQKELELEPTKVAVKPQIKHPNADQKRKKTTPVTTKSMPPEGFQRSDSESSSNRSSIDESRGGISESYTPFSPSLSTTAPDDSLRKSSPSPKRLGALPPISRKPKSDSDNDCTPTRSSALNDDSQRTPPTLREVKDKSETSTKKDISQSEIVDEIPEDVSLSQRSEKSDGSEFRPLKLDDLAPTKSEISEHVPSQRADTEKSGKGESSVSEMLPTKTDKTADASSYSMEFTVGKTSQSVTEASESPKEKVGIASESEKKDGESIISEAIPTAVDDSVALTSDKNELKLDLKLDTKPVVEFRAPDSARTMGDVVTDIPEEFSQHSIGDDLKVKEDDDKTDKILTARSHRSESDLWDYVETHPEDKPPKDQSQASEKNDKIENDISSVHSDKSSKSYVSTQSYHTRTYSDDFSDDFSDVSADRRSETSVRDSRKEAALSDDDISEHLSYRSEFSERSASEPKALDLSDNSLKLNLKGVEGDDDRTPIQSPAPRSITSPFESLVTSTPKPEDDPLAHINIGDSVMIAGIERGTLKFKGLTTFAPGYWAGIELETAEGTNDGSKDGVRYFDCKPKHGLFAPPDKVTYEPAVQKEHDDARSDTSDHTLTEEPIDIPSVSEKSEKITEEAKPLFSPRSVLDDSTADISISSDLERAITSAQAAVEGFGDGQKLPEKAVETEVTKPRKDMNKIVDSITDNLTEMVVKDSMLVMGDIVAKSPSKMLEEKADEEPEVAAPAAEKNVDEVAEVPENNFNNVADTATRNMLNDAISHMLTVRQNQISRSSESSQDDDGTDSGIPFDEYKDDRKSTPANSQTSIDTPESAFDNKFTPEDKITPEKKDLLIPKEDALVPPVRPVSPVFGESATKSVNQLNHDEVNARLEALNRMDRELMDGHLLGLGDQEWFDDDYGLSAQAQIPDHPPPPYPGSPPQHPQAGMRHDISKLELQRLTEEVFYAVPHKDAEVKGIISEVVDVFWERRRYGEPLDDVEPPVEFLTKDDKGQDIETNSRRVYKKLIFDLVAEHIREMYKDEEEVEPPPWAKTKRLTNKLYRGVSPPTTSESLKDLLSDRMMVMLGLKENQKESKVTRWSGRKKKDHVDEILVQELREEEPQWVNYDDDELAVKMQLTDAIFDLLLNETVTVFSQIQTKLDARVE